MKPKTAPFDFFVKWSILLCVGIFCFCTDNVHADTFTVTSLADDGSAGTLRAAINSANAASGSTITFASGLTGTITLTSALPEITAGMTIQGNGITVDGAGKYRPFFIGYNSSVMVKILGLTIQNGYGSTGSGIWLFRATLNLINCTITGNDTGGYYRAGGGINNSGILTMTNCTVSGNTNWELGSGIYSEGTATLKNCTFFGNKGSTDAIYNVGTMTMDSCTVSQNHAWGVNVSTKNALCNLTNCTIANNGDGGVRTADGTTNLTNCTVTGNFNLYTAGGIVSQTGTVTLLNCIVYGNEQSDIGAYGSGSITATYCDIKGGYPGTGNIDLDPCLASLADNGGSTQTTALGAGSPCLGIGTSSGAPTTDQRGYTRPNPPSIGAYDAGTPTGSLPAPVIYPNGGTVTTAQAITLSDANSLANIFYTTDGSTPTIASTKYTSPITIPTTETITAIAEEYGYTNSSVTSAKFYVQSVDLHVTDVHVPTSANAGKSISVTYAVQNKGQLATNTSWTDTIYLSTTSDLSGKIATIGTVSNTAVLPAGQNYTKTASCTIPSTVSAGSYYIVVQTDSGNSLAESATTPRIGSTSSATTITAAGHLSLSFDVPYKSRANRPIVGYFTYTNDGGQDLPAQLLVLSIEDGTPVFRLSQSDPWTTDAQQIIATGVADTSVIKPGESKTVPFYFNPLDSTYYHFELSDAAIDGAAIDWSTIESEVKPSDMDSQAWGVIWSNFKTQLGSTWQTYSNAITADAVYLSAHNNATQDVRRILNFEIDKASGELMPQKTLASVIDAVGKEPGNSLSFGRIASATIEQRLKIGAFGRGWDHTLNYTLTTIDSTHMDLKCPSGVERLFYNEDGKGWSGEAGDYGALVQNANNSWTLTEKDKSTMTFSSSGVLTQIADTHGNTISSIHNASGQLTELDHSNGDKITIAYDANGRITSVTDPAGRITTYTYDATDQLLSTVTAYDGRATSYAYASVTGASTDYALSTITYPDSTHLYYQYDSEGRLTGHCVDGGAQQVSYSFTDAGTIQITNAAGNKSSINYGIDGAPLGVTDATGKTASFVFDDRGNLTSATAPDSTTSTTQYDSKSNPTSSLDALGNMTLLGADDTFGSLSWLKDANGNESKYATDAYGENTAISYPDGTFNQFNYDTLGNVSSTINRIGAQISYTYDAHGRVLSKTYASGRKINYAYDNRGNLTAAADSATGTVSMTYNSGDYLTKIVYPSGHWLAFTYDSAGRRTSRTSDSGLTQNYTFDSLGRLSSVTDGSGNAYVSYSYDSLGRISKETKGNGCYTTYAYDSASRITDIVNYSVGGSVQSRYDYTFDANGKRLTRSTLAGTDSYAYDKNGQLVGATLAIGRTIVYAYDALGNRISATDNGVTTAYTKNALNQYTQVGAAKYTFDSNGNIATKTDATGNVTKYGYDEDNHLVLVKTASDEWDYAYDALGNRSTVTHNGASTTLVTDTDGDLASAYGSDGSLTASYIHGGGLVARVASGGGTIYYAFDGVGSTSEMTDASGSIVNSYSYLPFGEIASATGTAGNPFLYVGQLGVQTNADGTFWMHHRNYDPTIGRFVQPDPSDVNGGDVNLYRYAGNDPVDGVDPSGRSWYSLSYSMTLHQRLMQAIAQAVDDGDIETATDLSNLEGQNLKDIADAADDTLRGELEGLLDKNPFEDEDKNDYLNELINLFEKLYDMYRGNRDAKRDFNKQFPSHLPTTPGSYCGPTPITSHDPNEMDGPDGYGTKHVLLSSQPLTYTIFFENAATATAPAQTVVVTDPLPATLDPSTVSLGEVTFGSQSVIDLKGLSSGTSTVSLNNTSYKVKIVETTDATTGKLVWTLTCFDPSGAELPADAGFLPPNDSNGSGEGHVTFTVTPKSTVTSGTTISNAASIVFDDNTAISTNTYSNLIGSPLTDQLIKASTDAVYSGSEVYATTATIPSSQVVSQVVDPNSAAVYDLELANTGSISGTYSVTGPTSTTGWTIKYYDATASGNDITSDVTGAGWSVALDPGATKEYRVEITPDSTVTLGTTKKVLVTATSTEDSSLVDTVESLTSDGTAPDTSATTFSVGAPTTATVGLPVTLTIDALDQFGNIATSYSGTPTVTSSDTSANITQSSNFSNGAATYLVTFSAAGAYTVTASDNSVSTLTGTSASITVSAPTVKSSAPTFSEAGGTYMGSTTVTLSDTQNGTSIYYTIDGSAPTTSSTLYSSAIAVSSTTTIKAIAIAPGYLSSDVATATYTITAVPTKLVISAPASATQGSAVSVTVSAEDSGGNVVSAYTGPIHFSSSDTLATLPADSSLTNGTGSFSVTLNSAGSQSLTVTDAGSLGITGTATVSVNSATLHAFGTGWQMVASPYDTSRDDLSSIFNVSITKSCSWDSLNNAYQINSTGFAPGKGYWIKPSAATNLLQTGIKTTDSTSYSVSLQTGWNLIGNPRSSAVSLSSLVIESDSFTLSMAQANQLGLVYPTLYTYQSGDTNYESVSINSGSLQPYYGYWLYAFSPVTLVFPGQ